MRGIQLRGSRSIDMQQAQWDVSQHVTHVDRGASSWESPCSKHKCQGQVSQPRVRGNDLNGMEQQQA